jgi:hypothetical protein
LKQQKKMQSIYQKDGAMADSKFDFSLLKPLDQDSNFDTSQLMPVEEEPENKKGLIGNYMDYLKGLGAGGTQSIYDITKNITQFPSDIYSSLTGKEGYQVPSAHFKEQAPQTTWGRFGANVGDIMAPLALPVAGGEALASKVASPLLKNLTRLGAGAGLGAAESENRLLGGLVGGTAGLVGPAITGIGKAYNWLRQPSKTLSELKDFEKKLIESLQKRQENLGKFKHEATTGIGQVLPEKHFAETAKALSQALGGNKKKINEFFEKSYGEYSHGPIGQKPIKNPYELAELHNELSDIAGIPKSTIREAEHISPKIKFSDILDESGKPFEIEVPAKGSKLEDYIRFMRETRDVSGHAFKKAKSQNLTQSEKERYLDMGRKLEKISYDAAKRAKTTMTPEEAKNFDKINEVYSNVGAPLKYNPTFAKAFKSDKKLGKITEGFYHELLQPENESVRKYLFGSKDFKKALLEHINEGKKHPLANPKFDKKIQNIESLLKDKIKAGLLTNPDKKRLQDIVNMAKHQKSILEQMDVEAKKLGITREELEEQLKTRKTYAKGILTGGLGLEGLNWTLGKIFNKHND